MILSTALRQQGKLLLSKSKRPPIGIGGSTSILANNVESCGCGYSTFHLRKDDRINVNVNVNSATNNKRTQSLAAFNMMPIIQLPSRQRQNTNSYYHTTPSTFGESHFRLSTHELDKIKDDLHRADKDKNGKIDAEELKDLLRQHNDKFSDEEIVELGQLFNASSGAEGVAIENFISALDASMVKGDDDGGFAPLAVQSQFKTEGLGIGSCASEYMYTKTHGKYTKEELDIILTHVPPVTKMDTVALYAVKLFRFNFDFFTGWNRGTITPNKILNRAIFLETVAAIPGMVAAVIRHFRSLRHMARDGGMLNMFLEEANNERMHLLTFIRMKDPGTLFRAAVVGGQFGFGTVFTTLYIISPAFCHRFVGYIEEEACHTYTKIIQAIEDAEEGSELAEWKVAPAPKIAKGYWALGESGTVLDVMYAVRADEAEHRDVNHAVSGVAHDTVNPLYDPQHKMEDMLRKYVMSVMERDGDAAIHSSVSGEKKA